MKIELQRNENNLKIIDDKINYHNRIKMRI